MFYKTAFSFGGNDENERKIYLTPDCMVLARKGRNRNFTEMHPINGRFFICCQRHLYEPARKQNPAAKQLDRRRWWYSDILAFFYVHGYHHKVFWS